MTKSEHLEMHNTLLTTASESTVGYGHSKKCGTYMC